VAGLEKLPIELQIAWRSWIARFGTFAVVPKNGVKPGAKWDFEEKEDAPSPIDGLYWIKKFEYAQDAPCPPAELPSATTASPNEAACAVLQSISTLRQKSSPKDATPADYKLRNMRTSGTANGTNQVFTYISLQTGLVVRATEDAKQAMNVHVELTNGNNSVRYNMSSTSHVEIALLPPASAAQSAPASPSQR